MPTIVTNLNDVQINARIQTSRGLEHVFIAPKGRVTLKEGHTVDPNWLAGQSRVQVKVVTAPAATPTPPVTPTPTAP